MKKMITLYADEGKVLTNGEIYGTTISLATGLDETGFYEITEAEHNEIVKIKMEEEGVVEDEDIY